MASKSRDEIGSYEKRWPDGPQTRKEVRSCEPAGWAHSDWAWRSIGYVDRLGSVHPRLNKAECRCCLGVLRCQGCGTLVRPNTKVAEMQVQLAENCACGNVLQRVACEARTYRFVIKEDDGEYSVWEHTGYHHSHPHPPAGRQPSRFCHMGHNPSSLPPRGPVLPLQSNPVLQGRSGARTSTRKTSAAKAAEPEINVTRTAPLPPGASSAASSSNTTPSLVGALALVTEVSDPGASAMSTEPAEAVAWDDAK